MREMPQMYPRKMMRRSAPSMRFRNTGSSVMKWKNFAPPVGIAMKRIAASTNANAIVPAISLSVSCSSSSPAIFAEYDSERMPSTSDSTSDTVPRKNGFLRIVYLSAMECTGPQSTSMRPSGLRTAVATFPGPRIMTPSMTACPPTLSLPIAIPPCKNSPSLYHKMLKKHRKIAHKKEPPQKAAALRDLETINACRSAC